jgi:MFS family permease
VNKHAAKLSSQFAAVAGSPSRGYIVGGIVGGVVGLLVGYALTWAWYNLLLAVVVGAVVGSFYPGVGFAILFAGTAGKRTREERLVRIIHGAAFLVGPPVGAFLGMEWGAVGIILGAIFGGLAALAGAVFLSTSLRLPGPGSGSSAAPEPDQHRPLSRKKARRARRKSGKRATKS